MKRDNTTKNHGHIGDLWLPYQEGLLDPEERAEVEAHLDTCPRCAAELQDRRRWTDTLAIEEALFCPEPHEVFDFVKNPKSAPKDLSAHLEACDSCRRLAQAFSESAMAGPMPQELWKRLECMPVACQRSGAAGRFVGWLDALAERLSRLFQARMLVAAGAVAAAILVLVLVYPHHPAQPTIALSSVAWDSSFLRQHMMGAPEPGLPPDARPDGKNRLAIVLLLADFQEPVPQGTVDSLYSELAPPKNIVDGLDVLSPVTLKSAVDSGKISAGTFGSFLKGLHDQLGVSKAAFIKIRKQGNTFSIDGELADTRSGKTLRKEVVKDVKDNELLPRIRQSTLALIDGDVGDGRE